MNSSISRVLTLRNYFILLLRDMTPVITVKSRSSVTNYKLQSAPTAIQCPEIQNPKTEELQCRLCLPIEPNLSIMTIRNTFDTSFNVTTVKFCSITINTMYRVIHSRGRTIIFWIEQTVRQVSFV